MAVAPTRATTPSRNRPPPMRSCPIHPAAVPEPNASFALKLSTLISFVSEIFLEHQKSGLNYASGIEVGNRASAISVVR